MQKRFYLEFSICACECDKDCQIDEYLKSCNCAKSLIDDSVILCDEVVDILETVSKNSNDNKATHKMNYYILLTFLLVAILLLIIITICCYCIKHQSTQKHISLY